MNYYLKEIRWIIGIMTIAVLIILAGCSTQRPEICGPEQTRRIMHEKIRRFDAIVKHDLVPAFRKAGVPYPPRKIALLVFKAEHKMELWGQDPSAKWRYIRSFSILGASGGPGPKLQEGDRQVPEGIYSIECLNPLSHYDVSMRLNYPNNFDRERAKKDGRNRLGGDIYIHGGCVSIGCIAIGNRYAEELFDLIYHVGTKNVSVVIAPNDLRRAAPLVGKVRPEWLSVLDLDIKNYLAQFPDDKKYI